MIEVLASADVAVPAPELFAYVADMSNNPEWQQGQVACTWTSPPPVGVGSTYPASAPRSEGDRVACSGCWTR